MFKEAIAYPHWIIAMNEKPASLLEQITNLPAG